MSQPQRKNAAPSSRFLQEIVPPRRPQNLLRRQRLLDLLYEQVSGRLTLIVAPAGYGKTYLLIDFAHDAEFPVCWYSLHAEHRDPRLFLQTLVASIRRHFPLFGQETEHLLADPNQEIDTITSRLVAEIASLPDYVVIVLDDYQAVDDSIRLNLTVATLVRHLPDNCHLIISGRGVPTLTAQDIATLMVAQKIKGIGTEDLRFTPEEVQTLLREQFGQHISLQGAGEIAQETEGWIAGIILSSQAMWRGALQQIAGMPDRSREALYAYLAVEVLAQQEPPTQQFLLESSVLEQMHPALCDALLERHDSAEVLEALEAHSLFINRIERDDRERWFRYHQLFREFLLETFSRDHPEREVALHRRAAGLLRNENYDQAIHHYLEAGDFGQAAAVVREHAKEVYESGRLEHIRSWLDALPKEVIDTDAELLWFKAKLLNDAGDVEGAIRVLRRAEDLFRKTGNVERAVWAKVEGAFYQRVCGHLQESLEVSRQAVSELGAETTNRRTRAFAWHNVGICLCQMGNLQEGVPALRLALEGFQASGDDYQAALTLSDLGSAQALLGRQAAAEDYFRRALAKWEALEQPMRVADVTNNLAVLLSAQGRFDDALETFRKGLAAAHQANATFSTAFLMAGMGDVYRDLGEAEHALGIYTEALEHAVRAQAGSLQLYLNIAIGDAHRLLGDYDTAMSCARQAYDVAAERDALYERGLSETLIGAVLCQQGQRQRAIEWLTAAEETFLTTGLRPEIAKTRLHLAYAQYLDQRLQGTIHTISRLTADLVDIGDINFLAPVANQVRPLLEYTISRGSGVDQVGRNVMQRLLSKASVETRSKAPAVLVSEEASLAVPRQFFGLGGVRVMLPDRILTGLDSGMAVGAALLFYILLALPKGVTRDQLLAEFWPDQSPSKAGSSFHVTLHRLRRIIPDSILYERGQYKFDVSKPYWSDVLSFRALLQQARQTPDAQALPLLHEVITLYRGEFLEGITSESEWLRQMRTEFEIDYLDTLLRSANIYLNTGEYAAAAELGEKALKVDPLSESALKLVMQANWKRGTPQTALATYEAFTSLLKRELKMSVQADTEHLYHQIRQGS